MHTTTAANVRTTQAARTDLNRAMNVAFADSSVMGMAVVGLALAGLSILIYIFLRNIRGFLYKRESRFNEIYS